MDKFPLPKSWSDVRRRPRQTTVEYVRESLRIAILGGEIPGGTRLVQSELAAALDVSTMPIREALRELASEGLVRLDAHRGTLVCETNDGELDEIYEMCRALEPIAVRQAVKLADGKLIRKLHDLHGRMLNTRDAVEWIDLNRVFHKLVYDAAAKPRLAAILMNLRDARIMFVGPILAQHPELFREINKDHTAIIAALEQRDPKAAVDAALHHMTLATGAIGPR